MADPATADLLLDRDPKRLTPGVEIVHLPDGGNVFVSAYGLNGLKWVVTDISGGRPDSQIGCRFSLSPDRAAALAAALLAGARAAGWVETDG